MRRSGEPTQLKTSARVDLLFLGLASEVVAPMTGGRNAWAGLRSFVALILMAGSFLRLREHWHGSCILPADGWGDQLPFFAMSVLFLVGFV